MHEYEDYLSSPNIGTASEFITRAVEDHAEYLMSKKTYADYIATSPRAQRFGSHGLFTDDGTEIKLSSVSDELNSHTGNVWTAIVLLRCEDSERLGYDDSIRWRDMLRGQRDELAKNLKIAPENLRWFAADSDSPSDIADEAILRCPSCKNEVSAGISFCPKCGAKISSEKDT